MPRRDRRAPGVPHRGGPLARLAPEAADDGELFATHAAVALVGAQKEAELHAALKTRDVIGSAKGILMERHRIDDLAAFRILVDSSQHTNMKLHRVATWLVEHHRTL